MVMAGAFFPGLPSYAVAGAAVGAEAVHGCRPPATEAYGRISSSTLPLRRAVRTRKSGLCLRPRTFQSFWCLGVALLCTTVDTCSASVLGGFGRISAFSTLRQTRILMRSFSIWFEWRSVPSRCFWLQFCFARFALGNTGRTSTSSPFLDSLRRFLAAQCSWSPR